MLDEESVKRTIKILNAGIAIQDFAMSEKEKEVDVPHLIKQEGDKTLEKVII